MKKVLITSMIVLGVSYFAGAQGIAEGTAAIDAATGEVTTMYDTIRNFIYAVAGIVGMVAAFKLYSEWNSGDRDVQKRIIGWFGSAIFLVAAGAILGGFFGTGVI